MREILIAKDSRQSTTSHKNGIPHTKKPSSIVEKCSDESFAEVMYSVLVIILYEYWCSKTKFFVLPIIYLEKEKI